jgi:Tol biopolymer transport system component
LRPVVSRCIGLLVWRIALIVCAALPAASQATFAGRNGRVAAVRTEDPGCREGRGPECAVRTSLLSVRADGRVRRTLIACTELPCEPGAPAYSPDGRRLAYSLPGQLIVAGADGRDPRAVALPAGLLPSDPQWSPGGRRLAFVGAPAGADGAPTAGGDVWLVRLDGTGLRRLTSRGTVTAVTWSARGEVAFVDERDLYVGGFPLVMRIMRLDLRTGAVHVLTRGPILSDRASAPDWSPDGERLVFESDTRAGSARHEHLVFGLYVLDVRSGRLRRIHRSRLSLPSFPVWSPDGSRIAFVEGGALKSTSSRGGAVHTLLASPRAPVGEVSLSRPSWQPLPAR